MLMAVFAKAPEHLRDNVVIPHQTGYPMPSTGFTALSQCIKYARVPMSLTTFLMYLHDLLEQGLVRLLTRALRPFLPGVITASTDTQLPAQSCDRALCPVLVYEPEAIYFFPGNSFYALRRTLFSWRTFVSSLSNCLIFFCASASSLFEPAF